MLDFVSKLNCPGCGGKINEADNLCPHCGLDLDKPLEESKLRTLAEPHLQKARQAVNAGGKISEGLFECEQALEYLPESAEAHNLRGLLLDGLGRTDEALREYREAVQIDPDFQEAKENLADAEAEHRALKNSQH